MCDALYGRSDSIPTNIVIKSRASQGMYLQFAVEVASGRRKTSGLLWGGFYLFLTLWLELQLLKLFSIIMKVILAWFPIHCLSDGCTYCLPVGSGCRLLYLKLICCISIRRPNLCSSHRTKSITSPLPKKITKPELTVEFKNLYHIGSFEAKEWPLSWLRVNVMAWIT